MAIDVVENAVDQKWIDALRPWWGGGTVPFWRLPDGSIDATKTVEWLMTLRHQEKALP